MEIINQFDVPLDPADAWRLLLDIKRIMPCVPGAELLDVIDEATYKGKVSVKLGPVALAFVGTATFEEKDEAARQAKVKAKGSDAKGRGGANADVLFNIEPAGEGSKVTVKTNVNLSGSVAQYGRGTGVIQGVASQLTAQFARNLQALLAHEEQYGEEPPEAAPPPAAAAAPPVPPTPSAVPVQPAGSKDAASIPAVTSTAAPAPAADSQALIAMMTRIEAAAARVEAAVGRAEAATARVEATSNALSKAARPPAPPMPAAKPISGISLMFTVLWGMVTGIFRKHS